MNRIALALLIWLMLPGVAGSQESVAHLFPDGAELGEGWEQISFRGPTEALDSSFSDFGRAVYVGPNGGRAYLLIYRVAPGAAAIRNSWDIVNSGFDSLRSTFDWTSGSERELAGHIPPYGCVDARRVSGNDDLLGEDFPVGVTLCVSDPDLIVLALVNGDMAGASSNRASDRLVELTFEESEGTPVP